MFIGIQLYGMNQYQHTKNLELNPKKTLDFEEKPESRTQKSYLPFFLDSCRN